jgi:hypothetical protein
MSIVRPAIAYVIEGRLSSIDVMCFGITFWLSQFTWLAHLNYLQVPLELWTIQTTMT